MEYYSAWERKGILTPATAWMDLGDIMRSEITRHKDKSCVILLPGGPRLGFRHRKQEGGVAFDGDSLGLGGW